MTRKSQKNAHLLVEGKNDQHVIWALCNRYELPETFDVIVPGSGGLEAVLVDIPIRLKEEGLKALGIMLDADDNLEQTWQRVGDRLTKARYTVPPHIPPGGLIVTSPSKQKPRIGVWLMPNNQLPGMLEDFVWQLIPTKDTLSTIAETTRQDIEAQNLNRYTLAHHPKALMHTWLAWQSNPGLPLGQAITAQILTHNQPLAQQLTKWLTKLFT